MSFSSRRHDIITRLGAWWIFPMFISIWNEKINSPLNKLMKKVRGKNIPRTKKMLSL